MTPLLPAELVSLVEEDNVFLPVVESLFMILELAVQKEALQSSVLEHMVRKLTTIVLTAPQSQINLFKIGLAHKIQKNVQLKKMF